ncbi:MAG TPA: cytochrome c3 family protein [Kofleriaceae bacterium]|jgi:hypothetical protein
MRTLLTLFIAVWALCAGCGESRAVETPLPPIETSRLSHAQHAAIACTDCHRGTARPGADDHQPCDRAECHGKAFTQPPGKLCEVCHTAVQAPPLSAPLRPFPVDGLWQAEPPQFSHVQHLDAGAMESRVGFHVACIDCHTRDGALVRPDHATCARCHAEEAKLPKAPRMTDCAGCHTDGARPRSHARLISGDLHFDHQNHREDRRGKAIRCEECHDRSAAAPDHDHHAPPRIEACVRCHDDADRVPQTERIRVCETCHTGRVGTLASLAPRNHLPLTERPLDHTLAFRRDHAESAERDTARCATCHTQMSGNPRQACDECHQTMEPADHRITWRELDHGPEAAADRSRCARCHVAEFCTACHSQRPRSHGFPGTFTKDHGPLARIDTRSCVVCHSESYCADCHVGTVQGKRR